MTNTFLIKKPLATDKATALSSLGKYVFAVLPIATKPEIKKAIKELYHVDATRVAIVNTPPKRKKFRGLKGKQAGYTKAIVTLKKGQKIDMQ